MFAIAALTAALTTTTASAFWNNTNAGWNNNNGVFSYNPYSFFDPRWYFKETNNMMDEFDNEFGSSNNQRYRGSHGYRNMYQPYMNQYKHMNRNYGKQLPHKFMMTPYGPARYPGEFKHQVK